MISHDYERKEEIIKFYTFSLCVHIGPALYGLIPWNRVSAFYKIGRGIHCHQTNHVILFVPPFPACYWCREEDFLRLITYYLATIFKIFVEDFCSWTSQSCIQFILNYCGSREDGFLTFKSFLQYDHMGSTLEPKPLTQGPWI